MHHLDRRDENRCASSRWTLSQPWITATEEPGATAGAASARIRVVIRRDGPPRRFNEYIHVYADDQTNAPVPAFSSTAEVWARFPLTPEALYLEHHRRGQPAGGKTRRRSHAAGDHSLRQRPDVRNKEPAKARQGLKLETGAQGTRKGL